MQHKPTPNQEGEQHPTGARLVWTVPLSGTEDRKQAGPPRPHPLELIVKATTTDGPCEREGTAKPTYRAKEHATTNPLLGASKLQ